MDVTMKNACRIAAVRAVGVRLQLAVLLAFSLGIASPGRTAEYFWSSSSACSERQLQVRRIREGLRAGLIELRLAELGHGSIKRDRNWTPPQMIEDATLKGIDQYILNLQAICERLYPG
jgi:hypothetical protein